MAVVWPFLLAAGSYLLLRWVIWGPGGGSAATASQHAFWVGIMGWLASSLQPAGNAGILYASPDSQPLISTAAIVPALAWPILGSLAVHAIGQLSYPGPRLPRRQADLEVRRVRDFPAGAERLTADAPVGMQHVVVNGTPIRVDGVATDAGNVGQVVRPSARQ